jgi:uncharacterized protein (TIGR04255 family)
MARPEHLPDFGSPPLDEVFVGVQFAPPQNYTSVFSSDVWGLFKKSYPVVQEHPALEPSFETFGGSNPQSGVQFRFGTGPLRGRLWFISNEQDHLIQFQEDRFLLNWRKRPKLQAYPHFEGIADSFEKHLSSLQGLFETSLKTRLDINQAEVTYVNLIPVAKYYEAGDLFRIWGFERIDIENLNLHFNEVVHSADGKPYARLLHELQTVVTTDGKEKALRLTLTFRGRPAGNQIADAISFIRAGRERIVTRFSELTTEKAHLIWERIK